MKITIDLSEEQAIAIAMQAMENIAGRRAGKPVPTGHLPPFDEPAQAREACAEERCSRLGAARLSCLRKDCPHTEVGVEEG